MATVWMTVTVLYWNTESRTSYTIYPFKKYKFTHYCMWDIDWKRLFRNVWIIEDMVDPQYLTALFSHCKPWSTTLSTTVALISSDKRLCSCSLLPLPLFCLFTLPPCVLTPLLPLICWPWSFSGCSSIVRICNSCVVLCLYALQLKVHEMHLWAILSILFIYILFISESQDSLAQFMANRQNI